MTHWFDLFGRRPNRRDFLRVSGDVVACVALAGLPAAAQTSVRRPDDPFVSGVASGDPSDDGVVLWTRILHDPARPLASVRWEVAEDERFRRVVRSGSSSAPAELGYSVHAEVDGLRPGRQYWYRFNAGGQASVVGRTRTAPREDEALRQFRFAFISCQNYEHGYFTAFDHLADEDVDLVVHLGDYIYERRFASSATVREHEIATEVITLDEYRARYALYRSDPALRAAHAASAWVVTTDDHEVQNNYAGDVPERPGESNFLLRRAAAYQAYYEAMPLRRSAMAKGPGIPLFRRLQFGRLLDLHVLDTRQYRSDQPCGDGAKARCPDALAATQTMMGITQEQWLTKNLQASNSRWSVLANQVMIAQVARGTPEAPTYAMDKWDGYVAARQRLLRVLTETPSHPVVVTGDVHSSWVSDLKANFDDPTSPALATEFTGTSMSSGGDGTDGSLERIQSLNPHVKFYNARRGYVRVTMTPETCRADYRLLPYVTRPGAPIDTRASFVVDHARRGVQRA